ncbi:MAG: hypothetical protein AVDCRST_MAG21-1580 [uncultured Nocardioidaceae bacterium]|uniref:N-acetyltransferase domain-containing protein n=1 Tax=uncultured Nocardioidaceae bacterium TaxID=253824 RepID=A0A6J4NBD0_9ACTN|nr:MAG: hypothetical protein AVDCRST_MAG21-1580 [uncultured Nocardioidaceae bacterium]
MFRTDIDLRKTPYDHPDTRALTDLAQAYYRDIYGGEDDSPLDAGEFSAPLGAFYVGYLGGQAIAMGGWRLHEPIPCFDAQHPAELRRMYVAPQHRRQGYSRRLLGLLEDTAHTAGADAMVLETGRVQREAVALYRACGYVDIPSFGHYAHEPDAVHLGKLLGA